MNNYVLGFMFSKDGADVALIRKNKPEWQAGKLNGIGGKIEVPESAAAAMVREFTEETGFKTRDFEWKHFASMQGPDFSVQCFCCRNDLTLLRSMESEPVASYRLLDVVDSTETIENLGWLMLVARDAFSDGRSSFARIYYP